VNTNGFRVFIKTNQRATIWLKLQSVYSIYKPLNYDLAIKTEAEFIQHDNQRLLWQGIFLGVILIMSLYNFFIGVAVKDISYLYYVLSIVGIGTYFAFYYGFGIEYLWPKKPLWDTFCYLIIVPFSGIMRLLFTRTYLHTPLLLPNTNFLMNLLMGLNIFVMSFGLITYLFKIDIILILIEIIGFTGTAIHLLMLIAGIIAYREKYEAAKYFIWANLVLVVGAILFIGRELGFLEDNFMTRYLVQIGFLIQVVVFSLGLASRLNAMRSQLAKEMLEKERLSLDREREKKELYEQQRSELLIQVEQQTKDLKHKNIELEKSFDLVKKSENKQTELNDLKNKLFSIISHDLRNPLATMQSFLKLITEHHHKLTEDEKQKLYAQAQQSLDNLNLLMYNLLQWSRSQMNLLEFKSEKIYVRPILDNAAKVLQLNAHMKNISVTVQSEGNFCVYADKEMMEFVVRNLISNAIKFSHRNNVVVVKAYQQDNSIVIQVQDSGIGLSENKIKTLLEMNTTVSRRGTEKEKGTGLGLLISKEFIEKNKGRLYIISEPGKGSSFSFTLQKAG
jgi:signal transduction histidine kinase